MIEQGDILLPFDCETGGTIAQEHSLLTAYFCTMNSKFELLDELQLKLKPNKGDFYRVEAEALAINKINLVEHDKVALTYSEGGQKLREFLWKHSGNGKLKLIPVGHNVGFDEDFVWAHLLNRREFQKYVSYRKLDTACIGQFLKLQGKVPQNVTGSLGSFIEHFNIKWQGIGAHDEKSDTLGTVEVLKEMIKL